SSEPVKPSARPAPTASTPTTVPARSLTSRRSPSSSPMRLRARAVSRTRYSVEAASYRTARIVTRDSAAMYSPNTAGPSSRAITACATNPAAAPTPYASPTNATFLRITRETGGAAVELSVVEDMPASDQPCHELTAQAPGAGASARFPSDDAAHGATYHAEQAEREQSQHHGPGPVHVLGKEHSGAMPVRAVDLLQLRVRAPVVMPDDQARVVAQGMARPQPPEAQIHVLGNRPEALVEASEGN